MKMAPAEEECFNLPARVGVDDMMVVAPPIETENKQFAADATDWSTKTAGDFLADTSEPGSRLFVSRNPCLSFCSRVRPGPEIS